MLSQRSLQGAGRGSQCCRVVSSARRARALRLQVCRQTDALSRLRTLHHMTWMAAQSLVVARNSNNHPNAHHNCSVASLQCVAQEDVPVRFRIRKKVHKNHLGWFAAASCRDSPPIPCQHLCNSSDCGNCNLVLWDIFRFCCSTAAWHQHIPL